MDEPAVGLCHLAEFERGLGEQPRDDGAVPVGLREFGQDGVERASSAAEDRAEPVGAGHLDELLTVACCREVLYRREVVTAVLMPPGGGVARLAVGAGVPETKLRQQERTEQIVVAVHQATPIDVPGEGDAPLETGENPSRIHAVAQLLRESVVQRCADAGAEHEPPGCCGQTLQHFGEQLVGDLVVVTVEPCHERRRILPHCDRQAGALPPCRPPLGAGVLHLDLGGGESDLVRLNQIGDLLEREGQDRGTQLP